LLFFGGLPLQNNHATGIILFSKIPKAGFVKTRLNHQSLNKNLKVALQTAMLKDSILGLNRISKKFVPILSHFPKEDKGTLNKLILDPLKELCPEFLEKIELIPQEGQNIGERFTNSFLFAFNQLKLDSVIIIGSDTPHLQPNIIELSIDILQQKTMKAVLGPSQNGGFYLLGHSKPHIQEIGAIFQRKTSYHELINAMELLISKNYSTHILPEVTDVDTFDNLKTVREIIKLLSYTSFLSSDSYLPQFTYKFVTSLDKSVWL